ncbi:MAG: hypothetical protein OQK98_00825 [Gammaproteobacteria bacterium]|nr:hypothetical protein [Gammaproteobacteria bacterium]
MKGEFIGINTGEGVQVTADVSALLSETDGTEFWFLRILKKGAAGIII